MRSAVCSTLQLRPVPGNPTVVRAPPLRLTGMLNEAALPPTEIELMPPLREVEAQRANACRAAEAEAHGDQRLLTQ